MHALDWRSPSTLFAEPYHTLEDSGGLVDSHSSKILYIWQMCPPALRIYLRFRQCILDPVTPYHDEQSLLLRPWLMRPQNSALRWPDRHIVIDSAAWYVKPIVFRPHPISLRVGLARRLPFLTQYLKAKFRCARAARCVVIPILTLAYSSLARHRNCRIFYDGYMQHFVNKQKSIWEEWREALIRLSREDTQGMIGSIG